MFNKFRLACVYYPNVKKINNNITKNDKLRKIIDKIPFVV
jgi:hypothetical protein